MPLRRRSRPPAGAHTGLSGSLRVNRRLGLGRIVLLYALFATLWILLSDRAVRLLFRDPAAMMLAGSVKGLLFVAITSGLLYATLKLHVQGLAASEQIFANIFRLGPDAVDLTRLDTGVSLDLNASWERMYGYTRAEVLGHSTLPGDLGIWVNPADRERHVAELKAHGTVLGFQAPMRRKDGSTFIAFISSSVLEIQGQRCNLTLARDITEQDRAEAALRESSQRLELAAASASLGIWDRDLVARTVIWNDRMYELYGLERRPGVPDYDVWYRDIVHPDELDAANEMVRAALAGERPYAIDFRAVHPDGSIRHISSTGLVVRDASIELVALLEAGDLDCAFEYESVARQHHLPFVTLPAQIDLGSQRYAADYAKVAVAIAFQRFATVKPLFVGAPIAYAVTIPLTAHDPAGAARFVAFLLGPRGRAILAANDQPAVTPALVDHYGKLPAALRPLCVAMKPGEVP